MAMKVSLSFKDAEKEMYDFLMNQLSSSIYIKQLIKNEMEKSDNKASTTENKKQSLLDF